MKTSNDYDDATAPLVVATIPQATAIWTESSWTCPKCTLCNVSNAHSCEACTFPKPLVESPPFSNKSFRPHQTPVYVIPCVENNGEDTKGNCCDDYDHDHDIRIHEIQGEEDPYAKKRRRRRRRRWRMACAATAGAIVGGVVFFGPWGWVVGGIAGGTGARILSKRGEKKKDMRVAKAQLYTPVIG